MAHHLGVLQDAGLVGRSRSEGDARRTYVHLRAEGLTGLTAGGPVAAVRVVVVCTHNSARSQLAAALLAQHSPVPATSAGTDPADAVHPRAVAVARRHGVRLGRARTAYVDQVLREDDLVIAVCDNAHTNIFPPAPVGCTGRCPIWPR